MAKTKSISANAYKNDGGSMVVTGSASSLVNSIGMDKLSSPIALTVTKDTTEADKVVSARAFNVNRDTPLSFISSTIGGAASTAMNLGTYQSVSNIMPQNYGERLNITSQTVSGMPVFGANRGVAVLVSGINGVTGKLADQVLTGEFNYTLGGVGGVGGVINADY